MKRHNNSDNHINLIIFSIILFFGSGWFTIYLGIIGKYGSMLSGIFLLCYLAFKRLSYANISKITVTISLIIGCYIMFLAIAFFRMHSFDFKNLMFGLNGLTFMIIGTILGGSSYEFHARHNGDINIKRKIKIGDFVLPGLLIFGLFSTQRYVNNMQVLFVMGVGRDMGDGSTNPVGIAYVFSLVNICTLYFLVIQKNTLFKILGILAFMASIFIVISTTSRGAILYCLISYIIVAFSLLPVIKKNFNISWLVSIVSIVIILALSPILLSESEFFSQRINSLIYRFTQLWDFVNYSSNADMSADSRMQTYKMWLGMAGEWILLGQKYYSAAISYPHNSVLEIAARFGIFGWPLIIALILTFLKSIIRLFSNRCFKNKESFLFYLLFLFSFFQSMTSLSLEINRALWLAFGYVLMYKN